MKWEPDWQVYRRLLHLAVDDAPAFLREHVAGYEAYLDDGMIRRLQKLQRGIRRRDPETLSWLDRSRVVLALRRQQRGGLQWAA
jgi:hypothetical protein